MKKRKKKEVTYPRQPKMGENLIGKVCCCSVGRPAIVTGIKEFVDEKNRRRLFWAGLGLDGKGTWASSAPCVLAESGQDFHDKLEKRFGGKMSNHG